ncbi:MAG: polysaccharide deacetylase family protein [Burkholderiales bacterium]|jgi:peptidoglycan/xylan/chitin deacetylase (PgdA/CDA1 family)|nr:polysaccharide deacetylase family protein [Burkholderiales bacterium]
MRRASLAGVAAPALLASAAIAWAQGAPIPQATCDRPLYLTFDTGHMGVAPLVAEVLHRQQVRVTFFAANEKTLTGGSSLDDAWAAWWRARAAEGHAFASHTWEHAYWRADLAPAADGSARFRIRTSAGSQAGRDQVWSGTRYCQEIDHAAQRLQQITGKPVLPMYRAPGGKTSPALLATARGCGWAHAGWSPAGFLGDELPSETASNEALLAKALREIRGGDVLLAHLGIWSRRDPWAPAVLEPLIAGLKSRGFCFRTLDQHPDYAAWVASHPRPAR